MDSVRLRKLQVQIKAFLFSKRSREFLIFLLFFAVAGVFWLLQTLNETYETELTVPLKLTHVPADVTITHELPPALQIKVKDRGNVLTGYFYGDKVPAVELDYTDYEGTASTGGVQVPMTDVQKALQRVLESSTQVEQIRVDTLFFYYNKGVRKRLPVRLNGRAQTVPQCYLVQSRFTPDSVWVYAPQAVLDTMQAVYTTPVRIENLKTDLQTSFPFMLMRGMKAVPDSTTLRLDVDVYTENTVEVPITAVDFPPSLALRTFPGKVKVRYRIGATYFKLVNAADFLLTVSYDELLQNRGPKLKLHFRELPPHVSNVRIQPAEVDYLIEQLPE